MAGSKDKVRDMDALEYDIYQQTSLSEFFASVIPGSEVMYCAEMQERTYEPLNDTNAENQPICANNSVDQVSSMHINLLNTSDPGFSVPPINIPTYYPEDLPDLHPGLKFIAPQVI